MAPRNGEPGSAPKRRFFLARSPEEGRAEMLSGEAEHAVRVLRLRVGDRLVGLDGRGGSWPLRVAAVGRAGIELVVEGKGRLDPPPGAPGATLPWIEIASPWPKLGRVEEMLDRLTQLGAASIARLPCERAGPHTPGRGPLGRDRGGELFGSRRERAERVLREACKQSGRTWMPVLRESPSEAPAEILLLDPGSGLGLPRWIGEVGTSGDGWRWNAQRPLRVLVGPEGGFTPAEREGWLSHGAVSVHLGPHVLRLETAAEAAMAILAAGFFKPPRT